MQEIEPPLSVDRTKDLENPPILNPFLIIMPPRKIIDSLNSIVYCGHFGANTVFSVTWRSMEG